MPTQVTPRYLQFQHFLSLCFFSIPSTPREESGRRNRRTEGNFSKAGARTEESKGRKATRLSRNSGKGKMNWFRTSLGKKKNGGESSVVANLCPKHVFGQDEPLLNRFDLSSLFVKSVNLQKKTFKDDVKRDEVFRMVSYNVHMFAGYHSGTGPEQMVDAIRNLDPDVLVLQEYVMEDVISKVFPHFFFHLPQGYLGNAIGSKTPFLSGEHSFSFESGRKGEKRGVVSSTVEISEAKLLTLVGTHLDVWDESGSTRVGQVQELLSFAEERDASTTVIVGDMNALHRSDYSDEHWKFIEKQDRFRGYQFTPSHELEPLFANKWVDPLEGSCVSAWPMRRVDFGLVKEDSKLKIRNSFFYPDPASDHLPLVIDFEK